MAEWILILTLIGDHYNAGHSVTSVPGFASREACIKAGNLWLKQAKTTITVGRALCVTR